MHYGMYSITTAAPLPTVSLPCLHARRLPDLRQGHPALVDLGLLLQPHHVDHLRLCGHAAGRPAGYLHRHGGRCGVGATVHPGHAQLQVGRSGSVPPHVRGPGEGSRTGWARWRMAGDRTSTFKRIKPPAALLCTT